MIKFAVNYSLHSADLLRSGQIEFDLFKCPAWPGLLPTVQAIYPLYVHFPLKVGQGIGDAIDAETHQPADWRKVEALLAQTDTLQVNAHLGPEANDYPDMPAGTSDAACGEWLTERMIRDVSALVKRFGPERVIVENESDDGGRQLRPAVWPKVIRRVIEATGCGLLLNVSHARLAASYLGMDAREYINALPVDRIREMHITGLQRYAGRWVDNARRLGADLSRIQHLFGQMIDHLPMTDADWKFAEWSIEQIQSGAWGQPLIVALEYGGISPLWEAITDRAALLDQVPRLYELIRKASARS
jgi:uncharacterized protein (UPF0276 family)